MGASHWDSDSYNSTQAHRQQTGTSAFVHDTDVREGRARAGTHTLMNPHGVRVRESRDSAAHPDSVPVGVMVDVTGSMSTMPVVIQKRLGRLMTLLIERGILAHPQILFGAIGDAGRGDAAPLQVGQFESGLEMDADLGRLYLEGGGGGNHVENYELAWYFFARHTATDSWEKRQRKGYLFTVGDEAPYAEVSRRAVQQLIGDGVEADLSLESVLDEVRERFHVFHVLMTQSAESAQSRPTWRRILGKDHVLELSDPNGICEAVALAIGITEGVIDPDAGEAQVRDLGTDAATVAAVRAAVQSIGRGMILR